jgi:hypothetical protein
MIRALSVVVLLALSGCAGIPAGVLIGLQAAGAVAYLAKEVVGIDVALTQDTPGKTPVAAIIAPVVPGPYDLAHEPIR